MKRLINWLGGHRIASILILITYYLAVVLPHKAFGTFLNRTVVGGLGIDNNSVEGRLMYNLYAMIIAFSLLLGLLYFFIRNTRSLEDKRKIRGYMILNILLAAIIVKYLFVVNIEFIHFPQYALFAVLAFPIIGNYQSTLIWSTLAGMVDEAYQYFYLAPLDTPHYDFNDALTNLVGAVFGLLLLRSFRINEIVPFRLVKASFWYGISALIIVVVLLHSTDILSIYPSEDHNYHIVREMPRKFWSTVHPNVRYHVVRPLEGIALIIVLWISYSRISPKGVQHA